MRKTILTSALLGAAAIAFWALSPASAQDKVTIRFADIFPPGHSISDAIAVPFIAKVKEKLGDRIDIQYFPSNQLGKGPELLALAASGAVDMAMIVPSFTPEKLPRSAVGELPGLVPSSCVGTAALAKLSKEGELMKLEYEPAGVKVLVPLIMPQYQLLLKTPIESADSFKGKKIYATGAARSAFLTEMGAAPTRMASAEIYEALVRNTIDGVLFSYPSAISYNLQEQVKSSTIGGAYGTGVSFYAIGLKSWNALPDDVKAVFDEVSAELTLSACKEMEADDIEAKDTMEKGGVTFVDLSSAKAQIDAVSAKVIEDWAKDLDQRGLQGNEVLKAFRDALPAQ